VTVGQLLAKIATGEAAVAEKPKPEGKAGGADESKAADEGSQAEALERQSLQSAGALQILNPKA
jgi:pyruvate/2-oxoglutarate dehydrogenase complex dihydrolipoamide acyltransferase (E2) component